MAGDTNKKKLVGRHKRVAFMDVAGDGKTFTRMTGFTSMSDSKNSTEYSRQYVDEASERSDVVGYAPSMDYEFDRYTNDAVHAKLAEITDDEILGSDAQVTVVVVDLFDATAEDANTCTARKRDWSVMWWEKSFLDSTNHSTVNRTLPLLVIRNIEDDHLTHLV